MELYDETSSFGRRIQLSHNCSRPLYVFNLSVSVIGGARGATFDSHVPHSLSFAVAHVLLTILSLLLTHSCLGADRDITTSTDAAVSTGRADSTFHHFVVQSPSISLDLPGSPVISREF